MKGKFVLKYVLPVLLIAAVTASAAASGQSPGAAAPAGKKSFSILHTSYLQAPVPPDIDVNNNKWVDIIKRENPDLDIFWIIIPPDQLNQRVNVMVGSGDMPDVLPMSMAQMIQWSDMGIIRNIDGLYQANYKNIFNFLNDDDLKTTRYKGHQYGIKVPDNRLQNPGVMMIRTDWLDKLKLSMPKTMDELYNVLRAFTFNDPDGNGQKDTYGVAGCVQNGVSFSYMAPIFNAFDVNVAQGGNFSLVGNQIIPDMIRPEMKNAIIYLEKLYREGIMDKDTMTINPTQLEDKAVRGIAGMTGAPVNGFSVRIYPNMLKANPNAKIEMFVPPPAPNGKVFLTVGRNGGIMFGMSAKCKVPEAVLQYFNWTIEQDKSTLPFYTLNMDKIILGVLGEDSVPLGNKFYNNKAQNLLTPAQASELWRQCYRFHGGTIQALPDDLIFESMRLRIAEGQSAPFHLTAMQNVAKYGRPNAAAVTGPVYAQNINDIMTYWEETISGIVTGTKPITAYDDFIRFFNANGGQKIIDEITALNK